MNWSGGNAMIGIHEHTNAQHSTPTRRAGFKHLGHTHTQHVTHTNTDTHTQTQTHTHTPALTHILARPTLTHRHKHADTQTHARTHTPDTDTDTDTDPHPHTQTCCNSPLDRSMVVVLLLAINDRHHNDVAVSSLALANKEHSRVECAGVGVVVLNKGAAALDTHAPNQIGGRLELCKLLGVNAALVVPAAVEKRFARVIQRESLLFRSTVVISPEQSRHRRPSFLVLRYPCCLEGFAVDGKHLPRLI
mmetsp:Transcript_33603/g.76834  ORF Transcript_33603/g.76834 Transcript_33603/m.76834 type:complete len:248 (-) Transcript_33603:295-1038(-)